MLSASNPKKLKDSKLILLVPVLDFGGVETRIAIQAENMKHSVKELRVCVFWKTGTIAENLKYNGIPVDVLDIDPSIKNPKATLKLYRYLKNHQPDILHTRIGEANFHGIIAGFLAKVPVRIAEEVGIPKRSKLTKLILPFIYRLASRVVGVSQATCDFLVQHDRVDKSKIRLVYNAANNNFFESNVVGTINERFIFRIVTVGRLAPVKNQAMLIAAFASFLEKHPCSELVIVGEGPSRSELETLITQLQLSDFVTITGFKKNILDYLKKSDLFVLPSFSEGFGISLVEAMACEVPVLASNVGGTNEILQDLDDGFLIDPNDQQGWTDAMDKIASMDPSERNDLGKLCRNIAHTCFSPAAYVSNLSELYSETLALKKK